MRIKHIAQRAFDGKSKFAFRILIFGVCVRVTTPLTCSQGDWHSDLFSRFSLLFVGSLQVYTRKDKNYMPSVGVKPDWASRADDGYTKTH